MARLKSNSIAVHLNSNRSKNVQHYSAHLLLVLLILLVGHVGAVPSVYAEVLSCKDHAGNSVFTDNRSHCAIGTNDSFASNENGITTVKSVGVTASQTCGKRVINKHKVDYCTPRREYYKTGNNWTIYLEKTLVDTDKSYPLCQDSCHPLKSSINSI